MICVVTYYYGNILALYTDLKLDLCLLNGLKNQSFTDK